MQHQFLSCPSTDADRDSLQVTLAAVLGRSDQECLLSELKTLQTETQITISSKAEVQAVCQHLQDVSCR